MIEREYPYQITNYHCFLMPYKKIFPVDYLLHTLVEDEDIIDENEYRLPELRSKEKYLEKLKSNPIAMKENLKKYVEYEKDHCDFMCKFVLSYYEYSRFIFLDILYYKLNRLYFEFPISKIFEYDFIQEIKSKIKCIKKDLQIKDQKIDEILDESTKLMSSKFFENLTNVILKNPIKYDQLIFYFLRSPINYAKSREKLYMLVSLKKYFKIDDCKIIGLDLTPKDLKILKELQFNVIENLEFMKEPFDPDMERKKLIYKQNLENKISLVYINDLIHDRKCTEYFLDLNLNLRSLNNLHLLCNNFNKKFYVNFSYYGRPILKELNTFNLTKKLKIVEIDDIELSDKKDSFLDNLALHKFNTNNITDEQLRIYSENIKRCSFNRMNSLEDVDDVNDVNEILIKSNKLMESKYFKNLIKLINKKMRTKKGDNFKFDQLISYGLGTFNEHNASRQQLYLLICLRDYFKINWEIYDPAFTDEEKIILKKLNFKLIDKNTRCKRNIKDKRTLFFTQGLVLSCVKNILKSNWNLKSLDNIFIFHSNLGDKNIYSFEMSQGVEYLNKNMIYISKFKLNILKCCKVKSSQFVELRGFNRLCLHYFDVSNIKSTDLDLYKNELKFLDIFEKELNDRIIERREKLFFYFLIFMFFSLIFSILKTHIKEHYFLSND